MPETGTDVPRASGETETERENHELLSAVEQET